MHIFITGGHGQLGHALTLLLRDQGHSVVATDIDSVDITNRSQINAAIASSNPDVVLHCAAYTDVDGCAREPHLAYQVNGLGAQNVALACAEHDATLLYISSNEVFDGRAAEPYDEFAPPNPINPYGRSKLAGEWYTRHLTYRFYIVRTAWLYAHGGRNFIHRIQELADQHGKLRVVTDEVASPTAVVDLAEAISQLILTDQYGIYHLVNDGHVSRYDFAREILNRTGRGHIPVEPITLADFRRDSTPPAFTPLANHMGAALGIRLRPWQDALAAFLEAH